MRILFTRIYWLLILFKKRPPRFSSVYCLSFCGIWDLFRASFKFTVFFSLMIYGKENSELKTCWNCSEMAPNATELQVIHTREGVWQSSGTFSYVDVLDVKNGNWKLVISLFRCSDSTNSYWGSKTKPFRFVVWDRSIPSSKTWNFQLLLMTSGMSAFLLLKLANIYLSSFTLFWTAMRDWTFPYKLLHDYAVTPCDIMLMATMMIGLPVVHQVGVGAREWFAVITAMVPFISWK